MTYARVTREEIERELLTLPPTLTGMAVRSLFGRLMAQSDAYRELALDHYEYRFENDIHLQDAWDGKTTTEEEVDDAAAKIIERGKL